MCRYGTTADMAQRLRAACEAYYYSDPYQTFAPAGRRRGDESLFSLLCGHRRDTNDDMSGIACLAGAAHSDAQDRREATTQTATPGQRSLANPTPIDAVALSREGTVSQVRKANTSPARDRPDYTAAAASVVSIDAEAVQQQGHETKSVDVADAQKATGEDTALAVTVDRLLEKLERSAVKVVALDDLQQQLTERFALREGNSTAETERRGEAIERQELALHLYGLRRQLAQLRKLVDVQEAERAREARSRRGKDASEQRSRAVRVEIVRACDEPEPRPYVRRRPPSTRGGSDTAASASTRRGEYTSSTFLTSTPRSTTSVTTSSSQSSPAHRTAASSEDDSVAELFWQRRAAALRQQKAGQTRRSTTSVSSTYTSASTSVT